MAIQERNCIFANNEMFFFTTTFSLSECGTNLFVLPSGEKV